MLTRLSLLFCLITGPFLVSCASTNAGESLQASVSAYNQNLRWKRFTNASQFVPAESRAKFLERYLNAEDDLHIQSMEVRNVTPYTKDGNRLADVVLVAQAYILPSTVVEKLTIVQRWAHVDGSWLLEESSRELVPEISSSED